MKSFVAVLFVLFMAGCSSVLMKEPFPDSQLSEQEQAALTGFWQIDKQVVVVAFTSNGVPWLAFVEWEADDFHLKKYRLHFTKKNGALYLSMLAEPNGEKGGYYFAEIKADDQSIVVWNPNAKVFETLVANGALKGTVEKGKYATEIVLDATAREILDAISTNASAFDYKNPLVFRKVD